MSNNLVAESVQVVRSPSQLDPETHTECLGFIRAAIASNDRQTALDIKNVLADVCQQGHADRAAIWLDLIPIEQQNFKELLALLPIAPPEPAPETALAAPTAQPEPQTATFPINDQAIRLGHWVEARAIGWNDEGTQLVVEYVRASGDMGEMLVFPEKFAPTEPIALPAPTPTPTPEPELAESAEPAPEITPAPTPEQEPELTPAIAPEDAAKMREIALVWWPEMYPEALQSLVTQMFGWNAPARKYSAVQIAGWLQGEDELVRDRISELWLLKHGEGLDSLDCGF
ncbi:hypothetical protein [Microcoleus sp. D3_18a_C4]|uniref:hypothetical protein n=1 Tax=Microcoleus sp. D3_18a_C4 TaxID=3055332 RepID=UPI002FD7073F